ncbi:PIR Superfamily Protein [Plasmodium ovale curtisi]|uniref:PIR Superfamily Protein n=1 Tax=Plasmodium ovale curtisi TaxID=864141 RepID=A0A1A8WPK2_PLAOA|nr:PIR Superfamily Protein [Plasmodium ovale curtisi]
MTCETKKADKESYGFFESFDQYVGHAENAESINSVKEIFPSEEKHMGGDIDFDEEICYRADIKVSCNEILDNDISNKIQFSNILCEKFKNIYNKLSNWKTKEKNSGELCNNDSAFLNYWLNDKLRGNNNDLVVCVKEFYQVLRKMDGEYFKITTLEDKLYNMTRRDFENIKKLYELYYIKSKISDSLAIDVSPEVSASCLRLTKECYKKYKEAIINCRGDCSDFYSALIDFKNKYKDDLIFESENTSSCKYKELFLLPHYNAVLREHKNVQIIRNTALSVLFPVFAVLFMLIFPDRLTPFSKSVLEKIKRTKYILFDDGERDSELLSYTSDNYYSIGDQQEYNISYYSV